VPSNQQRREAERLRLQRQLEQRREREVSRRRTTLIVSVVVTLALIGGVIAVIAVFAGGGSSAPAAGPKPSPGTTAPTAPQTSAANSTTAAPTSPSSSAPALAAPKACVKLGKSTVHFDGVTVANATNLKQAPKVSSHGSSANALACADLVVGKGKTAKPTSTVSVQYTGVFYENGKLFDSSWQRGGTPISFPLDQVIPGFREGIGGTGKVAPMRVGGRRIIIMPSSVAYGSTGTTGIPPNTNLVFVVDLTKVSG
jgi:FKBP-type peptidyl-prolyl cis-trans isomerase